MQAVHRPDLYESLTVDGVFELVVLSYFFFECLLIAVADNSDYLLISQHEDAPLIELCALFQDPCVVEDRRVDLEELIWVLGQAVPETRHDL